MKPTRDPEPMALFGARLRQLRQQNGLTQLTVAERLCVDRTTYNKYEAGRVSPDQRGLVALAEMFSVTVDHLLGRETDAALLLQDANGGVLLSDQEKMLVQMFRQMSSEEQQTLVEQIQTAVHDRKE